MLRSDLPAWDLFMAASMPARWAGQIEFGVPLAEMAARAGGRLIYLATPYSREVVTPEGRFDTERSFLASERAARFAAGLAVAGATAISPVVLSVEMADASALDPLDAAFWGRWCMPLLAACGSVAVPDFAGWQASEGVWREVVWAITHGVPVRMEAAA